MKQSASFIAGFALALIAILTLFPIGHAAAQTCGAGQTVIGMTPGGNGIAPMPICGSSGNGDPASPQAPTGYWKKTWGAIATDNVKGIVGAATGHDEEDGARSSALADCKAKGGVACAVDLAYYNQCAAMVVGNRTYNVYGGPSIESAAERGLKKCNAEQNSCRIHYSACTKPVFISN